MQMNSLDKKLAQRHRTQKYFSPLILCLQSLIIPDGFDPFSSQAPKTWVCMNKMQVLKTGKSGKRESVHRERERQAQLCVLLQKHGFY